MGNVRFRPDTKRLYFDFAYRGVRCREYAALPDTPANRQKMEKLLDRIEAEIAAGTFDYAKTFPGSKKLQEFTGHGTVTPPAPPHQRHGTLPKFSGFADQWLAEHSLEWRYSHKLAVESIFKIHLMPAFGELHLDEIDRAKVMDFRRQLADPKQKKSRRKGVLAPATMNRIIGMLRMVMTEAGLRFGIDNPCAEIRRLKLKRTDIQPFSLEDINRLLANVRQDYRPYVTFRFFTGVRSAEANGLKWKYVDFERGQVMIRETYQDGRTEYTKNDGSQRDLQVSPPVIEALQAMRPEGYDTNPRAFADTYVEAPEFLQGPDGKVFLSYSASACWSDDYALGLLHADGNADLLNAAAWHKSPHPVFASSVRHRVYAPGHNGFFKGPNGHDWIIYHANGGPGWKCTARRAPRIQPFGWAFDGMPDFGQPGEPSSRTHSRPN